MKTLDDAPGSKYRSLIAGSVLTAIALALIGGCREAPLTTEFYASPSTTVVAPEAPAVRAIEFDVSTESAFLSRSNSRTQRMHVQRTTNENGARHTVFTLEADTSFASSPFYPRRLARIEVNGEGQATAFLADGSQRSLPIDARDIAKSIATSPATPDALRQQAERVAANSGEFLSVGAVNGAWIETLISTPHQREMFVQRIASGGAAARIHLDGFDRYVSVRGDQSAALSIDPATNLLHNVTLSRAGREYARASYGYAALDKGLYLRTELRISRTDATAGEPRNTAVLLTNISVNGAKVLP